MSYGTGAIMAVPAHDERDWEYSIERILHNFALRLVVPEKYYKR